MTLAQKLGDREQNVTQSWPFGPGTQTATIRWTIAFGPHLNSYTTEELVEDCSLTIYVPTDGDDIFNAALPDILQTSRIGIAIVHFQDKGIFDYTRLFLRNTMGKIMVAREQNDSYVVILATDGVE